MYGYSFSDAYFTLTIIVNNLAAPIFRRSAIAHMAFYNMPSASEAPLVFPHRKRVRLRVALKKQDTVCHSQIIAYSHETLEGAIRDAQKEVIESEIFDELIKEASTLPTASTRVSERLIIVDAAHDTELSFELVGFLYIIVLCTVCKRVVSDRGRTSLNIEPKSVAHI